MVIKENIQKFFENTYGLIEATDFERFALWKEYHGPIAWDTIPTGIITQIGTLDNRPICISLFSAVINNRKIVFWHATSQIVDYYQIENWLDLAAPAARKTDANNATTVLY